VALSIRAAGPADLTRLSDIYRRSSLSNEGDRQALLDNPDYLELPAGPVLAGRSRVAERAPGDVVGFATVERTSTAAELVDLFVDPDFMRRGVARALITDAITELAKHRIRNLDVTANGHALAFYAAMGFEVVDTIATPLGSGVRMRLRLGESG
jgi:ribosomal protein S18 acetylase RimI-like enzyme